MYLLKLVCENLHDMEYVISFWLLKILKFFFSLATDWWKKQIIRPLKNCFLVEVMRKTLIISFPNLKVISWNMQNSFHINFFHLRFVKLSLPFAKFLDFVCICLILLISLQKSFHYIGLLKAVMRLSMTSLKGADAKDVASSITAIANEKIKAEKEANAGKKKTGTHLLPISFVLNCFYTTLNFGHDDALL